jgi:EAL domain-containing protein (putative c-di-GMP-specific phosphodiesterase class I)
VINLQEAALAAGVDQVKDILLRLKAHGLRLGIDSFGTGASSLGHIVQLPLDEMKLGAMFIGDMKRNAPHAKIVRSLAGLARELGLRVVAVGVEDAETALALSTLGVERIQGEYVSAALAPQEIIDFASKLAGLTLRPGTA